MQGQKVDELVKAICARTGIDEEAALRKQVQIAIDSGCKLSDLESALNHFTDNSRTPKNPLSEISKVIRAQVRASSSGTQAGFGQWEYVPDAERLNRYLTQRDYEILDALFHHHYLDRDMLAQMFFEGNPDLKNFQGAAKMALTRLYQAGLLLRLCEFEESNKNKHKHLPSVYTLSKGGYLELARNGLLEDFDNQWQPLPLRASSKINLRHELSVNCFCLQVIDYASKVGFETDWWAADEAYQKVSGRIPGQLGVTMEPDSVLWVGKSLITMVELEHSGRRKQMVNRLRRWNRYLAIDGWRGHYPFKPWLLFVVPLADIHNGATIQKMFEITNSIGIKADRVVLIPEEGPSKDEWIAQLFLSGERFEIDFWEWASKPDIKRSGND